VCGVEDKDGHGAPDKLLDELTEYITQKLSGEAFVRLVHEEVGHALDAAGKITLGEVVTPRQVSGAAIKYALEWRIEGALSGLVGEIAHRIHGQLLAEDAAGEAAMEFGKGFADVADKVVSLPAFQRVVDVVYHSPLLRSTVAWFAYQAAADALHRNREHAEQVPGLGALLRVTGSLGGRLAPELPRKVDGIVRALVERAVDGVVAHDRTPRISDLSESLRAVATELSHEGGSLYTAGSALSPEDIESLLVVGFELWDDLRRTRPVRAAIEEGVAVFFEIYSAYTLADLLDEIGVTRDDMIEEALRFAPRAIAVVQRNGMLDGFVRRQFTGFVESEQVRELLK
jgi:hypothetical protein